MQRIERRAQEYIEENTEDTKMRVRSTLMRIQRMQRIIQGTQRRIQMINKAEGAKDSKEDTDDNIIEFAKNRRRPPPVLKERTGR